MDVQEYLDGACRCIAWQVGDEDLQAALASVDAFLTHVIGAISAEDPQPWLEINLWLDSGRLMVYGSNTAKAFIAFRRSPDSLSARSSRTSGTAL